MPPSLTILPALHQDIKDVSVEGVLIGVTVVAIVLNCCPFQRRHYFVQCARL